MIKDCLTLCGHPLDDLSPLDLHGPISADLLAHLGARYLDMQIEADRLGKLLDFESDVPLADQIANLKSEFTGRPRELVDAMALLTAAGIGNLTEGEYIGLGEPDG